MARRLLIILLVPFFLIVFSGQYSNGEPYPDRPIELVVGWMPGATMDLIARVIADTAPKYLGQPVVVVNKPGAGGSIAAADVIRSKPDGYKLFVQANSYFAASVKVQKLTFDPNQLVPVANMVKQKLGLCVRGDSQWKTLPDLLAYAKANPGKLTWGHFFRGGTVHMAPLTIFKQSGVDAVEVAQKGSPAALASLLGGQIDCTSLTYGAFKDHVRAGRIRFLVFYIDARSSDEPDVPSATELGFPDVGKFAPYSSVYAHKDMPEKDREILYNALKKTYEDPAYKEGIRKLGEEPSFGGADFVNQKTTDLEKIAVPILKELGLYAEKK